MPLVSFVSLKVECKARGQVSKDLDAKVGTKVGSLRPQSLASAGVD